MYGQGERCMGKGKCKMYGQGEMHSYTWTQEIETQAHANAPDVMSRVKGGGEATHPM